MTNSIYTMTVTPNLQDFQIAVYHVLGTGLPKHIEDVITEITENFDIRYENPIDENPLKRTQIFENIIMRVLQIMEDTKDILVTEDGAHVYLSGKGKNKSDQYDIMTVQRLATIYKRKQFKRYSKEEIKEQMKAIKAHTEKLLSGFDTP